MVNTKNSIKGKCNLKQECIPWNKSLDIPHAGITSASDFSDSPNLHPNSEPIRFS